MIEYILIFIGAYIIGSIPSGYWFGKYFFGIDITGAGSKNIGATNVARVLGKKYFYLIFCFDFFKAFILLYLLAWYVIPGIVVFNADTGTILLFGGAFFILVGNAYSIFLKFKGGKGVATSLGVMAFLYPLDIFLLFLIVWIFTLLIFKRVDLASLFAILFSVLFSLFFFSVFSYHFLFLLFNCFWIWFRHLENLKNLIKIIRG